MKRTLAVLFVLLLVLCTGCSAHKKTVQLDFFAMDTVMSVRTYGEGCEAAAQSAKTLICELDALFDPDLDGSDIAAINSADGQAVEVDPRTAELLALATEYSARCEGAFDITVGAVARLWGFDGGEYGVPEQEKLSAALDTVDYSRVSVEGNTVRIPQGVRITVGGIAKGYACSLAQAELEKADITGAVLNLGGSVTTVGEKPDGSAFSVAVQSPFDESEYAAVLSVNGATSVVTSGGYRRFFEADGRKYHHIIDPATGYTADSDLASVTVICADATLADALSTALFVMGSRRALDYAESHAGIELVLVRNDGEVLMTDGARDSARE